MPWASRISEAQRVSALEELCAAMECDRDAHFEIACISSGHPDFQEAFIDALVYAHTCVRSLASAVARAADALDGWAAPRIRRLLEDRPDLSQICLRASVSPLDRASVEITHPGPDHKDHPAARMLVNSIPAAAWWAFMGADADELSTRGGGLLDFWSFTSKGVYLVDPDHPSVRPAELTEYERALEVAARPDL